MDKSVPIKKHNDIIVLLNEKMRTQEIKEKF